MLDGMQVALRTTSEGEATGMTQDEWRQALQAMRSARAAVQSAQHGSARDRALSEWRKARAHYVRLRDSLSLTDSEEGK